MSGRSPTRRDDGFAFVEVIVAMSILTIILTVLAAAMASSMRPVLVSKQRAVATATAQQVLEQARAIKFADLGLVSGDPTLNIATDPNLTGIAPNFKVGGEDIAYAASGSALSPHYVASFKASSTTLSRWVWVTQDGNLKRVTVRVQWANPGIGGVVPYVRASTLISPTPFTQAATPLTSATTVNLGQSTLASVVGSTVDALTVSGGSACEVDCGVTSTGIRNEVTCAGRTTTLDHSMVAGGSVPFGGRQVNTLADDDPSTSSVPQTDNKTASDSGFLPADIYPGWVGQSSVPSTTSCLSSVLGPNAAAGGDDDLAYEHGTTVGPAHLSVSKTVSAAAPVIPAAITFLDQTDANTATAEGETTSDTGPADTLVTTATLRSNDVRALAFAAPTTVPAIAATYGLVRAEAVSATTNATAKTSGSPAAPNVVSNTLRVWVYDPANRLNVGTVCTARSSGAQPPGYCIIDHDISSTSPLTFASPLLDQTVSIPGGGMVRWTVTLAEPAAAVATQTGTRGTTWSAQAHPLVASIGMCVTATGSAICTPDGKVNVATKALDLSANMDLGTVKAQALYGFPV